MRDGGNREINLILSLMNDHGGRTGAIRLREIR